MIFGTGNSYRPTPVTALLLCEFSYDSAADLFLVNDFGQCLQPQVHPVKTLFYSAAGLFLVNTFRKR
jgi:hypothetical protein